MKFEQGATLAEEIVQVAVQSESHGSLTALSNSINSVLQNHSTPDSFGSLGQIPNNLPGAGPTPTPRTPLSIPDPVSP